MNQIISTKESLILTAYVDLDQFPETAEAELSSKKSRIARLVRMVGLILRCTTLEVFPSPVVEISHLNAANLA